MAGPSGATPVLNLPFPIPDDTVDVPRDIQALATALDGRTSLAPPLVTSLPASPVDGQEVYYLANATNGVIWHLRYRASSGATNKWEFLGGSPLSNEVPDAVTTGMTAYTDLSGPVLTLPLAGDYEITLAATINGGDFGLMSVRVVGISGPANDNESIVVQGSNQVSAARTMVRTGLLAGAILSVQYRVNASGTAGFRRRSLIVRPIRVG